MTSTLCAATFSNSYVKLRLSYVMLRFVAVPVYPLILERAGRDGGDGPGRAGLAAEPAGRGPALHPLLQGLLRPHQVPHRTLHPPQ